MKIKRYGPVKATLEGLRSQNCLPKMPCQRKQRAGDGPARGASHPEVTHQQESKCQKAPVCAIKAMTFQLVSLSHANFALHCGVAIGMDVSTYLQADFFPKRSAATVTSTCVANAVWYEVGFTPLINSISNSYLATLDLSSCSFLVFFVSTLLCGAMQGPQWCQGIAIQLAAKCLRPGPLSRQGACRNTIEMWDVSYPELSKSK